MLKPPEDRLIKHDIENESSFALTVVKATDPYKPHVSIEHGSREDHQKRAHDLQVDWQRPKSVYSVHDPIM